VEQVVSWVVELALRPGACADFEELTAQMVAATRAEPGALVYERFVSADRSEVVLYERYADSEAALRHLRTFGERFAGRFSALVERRRVLVFGDPAPELRAVLDGIGAEYLLRLDGFSR
jgi:quinol monooxygenase YgiN